MDPVNRLGEDIGNGELHDLSAGFRGIAQRNGIGHDDLLDRRGDDALDRRRKIRP